MKIAISNYGTDNIDAIGGGEQRYGMNLRYFLQELGHEVVLKTHQSPTNSIDLFLDAPDNCSLITCPHVHNKFGLSDGVKDFACYKEGKLKVSAPYKESFENHRKWCQENGGQAFFIPMAYPDSISTRKWVEPAARSGITWALKDPFHPEIVKNNDPRTICSMNALKALVKFNRKTDFYFHLILEKMVKDFPPAMEEISKLKKVKFYGILPWRGVIDIMMQSSLSIHPAGLAGSVLESIYSGCLPIQHWRGFFTPMDERSILRERYDDSVESWEEALNKFWYDELTYYLLHDYYQECFKDHRTEGLIKHWKVFEEQIMDAGE